MPTLSPLGTRSTGYETDWAIYARAELIWIMKDHSLAAVVVAVRSFDARGVDVEQTKRTLMIKSCLVPRCKLCVHAMAGTL